MPHDVVDRDVVILGAGISGLLLGSELAKEFSVSVLEKEKSVPNRKYWVTNEKSRNQNPSLTHLVETDLAYMDIIAHDLTACRVNGPFPMWDSDRLISHLVRSILQCGAEIVTGTRFYSCYESAGRMMILAGERKYRARLVVDCMGFSSPILAAKGIYNIAGYYLILGGRVQLREPINPIGFYNVSLDRHPKYLEVFPTRADQAHASLIMPVASLPTGHSLQSEFAFLLHESHLSRHFEPNARYDKRYTGIIPVGTLRRRTLNRIFIFGEASQLNPAATATGLTRMLYVYQEVAAGLSRLVRSGNLSPSSLDRACPAGLSEYNRRLQLSVFRSMQNWTSDHFRELVRELGQLPNEVLLDILFGDVTAPELLSARNIKTLLNSKCSIVLRHALWACVPISQGSQRTC